MLKPNILLLVAHDLGCHIGPYGWAIDECPQLNRFAPAGIRLDRHFVTSPGCSQSRSSLVTGRYPHSNGQFGLAHLGWKMKPDEILLPAVLRDAGYHTGLIGIWHLHEWTLGGFNQVSDDVSTRDHSPEGFAEIASERAAQWLRARVGKSQPFYLHVGFWEAHRPFCGQPGDPTQLSELDISDVAVPDYLPENEATCRELAHLHKSVEHVDAGVGRVLNALQESGLSENTLVIFTADHGLPFPRAKGTLYDPGLQVALLARWPGRIAAGAASRSLSSNVDLMPTLLEAAGVDCPSRVQGKSFWPLLAGKAEVSGRAAIFAEKNYHEHYDPIRALRTDQWKYIRNFAERPRLVMPSDVYNSPTRQAMLEDERFWSHRPLEELYDLSVDKAEVVNLAALPDHQEDLKHFRQQLEAWMREMDDPLLHGPIARGTGKA